MKRLFIFTVSVGCLVTFLFTFFYAYRIFRSSAMDQMELKEVSSSQARIVMITQELESPFTKALQVGFYRSARENNMDVTVWGSYHSNLIELMKYMDIAIASKVDGIIVQAMDGPEFIEKVQKATEKGIPVITVGMDSPTSLRKTYVGPDHMQEGELIGSQIRLQMKDGGQICLVSGGKMSSTEKLRLEGVQRVLAGQPSFQLIIEEGNDDELNLSKQTVSRVLNRYPELREFVGLNAEAGVGIAQALNERGRGNSDRIYAFDDTPELREFVDSGRITSTLVNDNTAIGEKSMKLIKQWLQNEDLPLPRNVNTSAVVYMGKSGR